MRKLKLNKSGQEEIVGFALIVVLVSIILMVFIGFSLNSPAKVTVSYEIESFLSAIQQYNTDCDNYQENSVPIRKLINDCDGLEPACLDGREVCDVLNDTLTEMIDASWIVGEDTPIRGYRLDIMVEGEPLFDPIQKGNLTGNNKMNNVSLSGSDIIFAVYY